MRKFQIIVRDENGNVTETDLVLRDDQDRYDQLVLFVAKSTSNFLSGGQVAVININDVEKTNAKAQETATGNRSDLQP